MLALAIDVSIRAVAAALAIAVILRLLRVRSASLRHAAWSAVLVVMLAMPLLTAIVPGVGVPVPSTLAIDLGTVARREPLIASLAGKVTEPAPTSTANAVAEVQTLPAFAVDQRSAPGSVGRTASAYGLLGIYVAGVVLLGGRLAAGWTMARRLRRSADPTDLQAGAPVLESPAIAAPLTFGILHPIIVLPSDWRTWRPRKLTAILAHETAHVTRRDGLVAFLAEINRAFFWFNPLAWWLPGTLAAHAEHACDDAAARTVKGTREYAEVLVEIAEAVSLRGRRIAWQGLGVEGTGRLGTRIDRLLRGGSTDRPSRPAMVATAFACAVALGGAVACRQQPAPLQPDPELAKQLAEQSKGTSDFQASITMTLDEVDALESRITANPSDWDARRRLVTYYNAGTKVPWERKVPGLRRHALWLIEHHPEGEVAAPPLSPEYDPEGFAAAVRLWDRHLQKPDASPYVVYRAAQFFAPYDKPRAEQLILRGMAMDPDSEALAANMPARVGLYEWHNQLGSLYAAALLGTRGYYPTREFDPKAATAPFALEVRRRLTESRDARLLARVGSDIVMARQRGEPVEEMRTLGREYLERALALDPTQKLPQTMLARADRNTRHERVWHAVTRGSEVPEEDRLAYLASKASYAYMQLEAAESWRKNEEAARKAHDDAKAAAEGVLTLAAERRDSPDYAVAVMTAHQTLGLIALHDGDRRTAVQHMLESVKVPEIGSKERILEANLVAQRLPTYLLKEGERDSVIQYYEGAAKITPGPERDRLVADAQAVREGRMPRNYQHVFTRGR